MQRSDNAPQRRPAKLDLNAGSDEAHTEDLLPGNWRQWNQDNREAVAAYNERIEREGLPLARYRTFLKGR